MGDEGQGDGGGDGGSRRKEGGEAANGASQEGRGSRGAAWGGRDQAGRAAVLRGPGTRWVESPGKSSPEGRAARESWPGRGAARQSTRVGKHPGRKGRAREAGFLSPAPGRGGAPAVGRRRASEGVPVPAQRRPGVPRARRGAAGEFPGGAVAVPGLPPPPAAAAAPHLPRLGRPGRAAAAAGAAAGSGPPAPPPPYSSQPATLIGCRATGPRPPRPISAEQRLLETFSRARARRGHAAALRLMGSWEAVAAGWGLGRLWRMLAAPRTPVQRG